MTTSGAIAAREAERKNERRVATSLKLSGLPQGKTLEGFDWTFQPRADREKLEMLSTCAYVRSRENVLFLGPPGVGKSQLAVALGVKAVKNGFSVTHFVLDELMRASPISSVDQADFTGASFGALRLYLQRLLYLAQRKTSLEKERAHQSSCPDCWFSTKEMFLSPR